jgi:hypothetical protein
MLLVVCHNQTKGFEFENKKNSINRAIVRVVPSIPSVNRARFTGRGRETFRAPLNCLSLTARKVHRLSSPSEDVFEKP